MCNFGYSSFVVAFQVGVEIGSAEFLLDFREQIRDVHDFR
jgi:hypothetical protein